MPRQFDYLRYNELAQRTWESFNAGDPIKPPVVLGLSPEWMLANPDVNPSGVSMKEYLTNDDAMFEWQVRFEEFRRLYILEDAPKGIPDAGWTVSLDYGNYLEPAWYGAPVRYHEGHLTADATAFLADDTKNRLFDAGLPDPFGGFLADVRRRYDRLLEKRASFRYRNLPVTRITPMQCLGHAGPFTTACNLRGAEAFCIDLLADPDYAHALMEFITNATINRIGAWRAYVKETQGIDAGAGLGIGDDSITLLSVEQFETDVLPYHRRLYDALADGGGRGIHLCGDATRHFKSLLDNVGVTAFDTGFPIDHAKMCAILGPDVQINGGPHAALMQHGTPDQIRAEAARILRSGVNKKFVLREGNNMPAGAPLENANALYAASLECAWKPEMVVAEAG